MRDVSGKADMGTPIGRSGTFGHTERPPLHCQLVRRVLGLNRLGTCGSADRGRVSGCRCGCGTGEQVAGALVPGGVTVVQYRAVGSRVELMLRCPEMLINRIMDGTEP